MIIPRHLYLNSILFFIIFLIIALYLIPPPASNLAIKIPRIDAGSNSYFVVDKSLVNTIFSECEKKLNNMASKINSFHQKANIFAWTGYFLNLLLGVLVIFLSKTTLTKESFSNNSPISLKVLAVKDRIGHRFRNLLIVIIIFSAICSSISVRLLNEASKVEKSLWELHSFAGFVRVQLDYVQQPALAINLLERLKTEIDLK